MLAFLRNLAKSPGLGRPVSTHCSVAIEVTLCANAMQLHPCFSEFLNTTPCYTSLLPIDTTLLHKQVHPGAHIMLVHACMTYTQRVLTTARSTDASKLR